MDEDDETFRIVQGRKIRRRRKIKKANAKKNETIKEVKGFLNRPMYETTIGDQLIVHACTVVISITITAGVSIFFAFLQSRTQPHIHPEQS